MNSQVDNKIVVDKQGERFLEREVEQRVIKRDIVATSFKVEGLTD